MEVEEAERTALTIAGSDPSGGAGIQADLKTFAAFEVYGMSAITALTIGNTCGVTDIQIMDPGFVGDQIRSIGQDIPPAAVKTGLLGSSAIIKKVARALEDWEIPLVVDPVIATKRGDVLLPEEGVQAYREELVPLADVLTPNIPEAEQLTQMSISSHQKMTDAAEKLHQIGCHSVILKAGYFDDWQHSNDLYYDGDEMSWLESKRFSTKHTHGAGDAFSAAIAASLAQGTEQKAALKSAKSFVTRGIELAPHLGKGEGPIFLGHYDRP